YWLHRGFAAANYRVQCVEPGLSLSVCIARRLRFVGVGTSGCDGIDHFLRTLIVARAAAHCRTEHACNDGAPLRVTRIRDTGTMTEGTRREADGPTDEHPGDSERDSASNTRRRVGERLVRCTHEQCRRAFVKDEQRPQACKDFEERYRWKQAQHPGDERRRVCVSHELESGERVAAASEFWRQCSRNSAHDGHPD